MRILIAPDSFKESLSSKEAALAIQEGFKQVFPKAEYRILPMADGGEGTTESILTATQGKRIEITVQGPLGTPVKTFFGLVNNDSTAMIEVAAASGLQLVPMDQRNPMLTSSYGTGEIILAALNQGVQHFVLGLGGSATNDGGVGLLGALGAKFLNASGGEIPLTGGGLADLAHIDLQGFDPRLKDAHFDVACDVDNPLCGPEGASAIFGPQKGATPEMVKTLDLGLQRLAQVANQDLGLKMDAPGCGAAGGIGGAVYAFLHGQMRSGLEIVAEVVGLEAEIKEADLILTGEGRIDGQSLHGKTPVGVAKLAKKYAKPVIAIGGTLTDDAEKVCSVGIDAITPSLRRPCTLAEALKDGGKNLTLTAADIARMLLVGNKLSLKA